MKKLIGSLDAVPKKRTFLSIIADYDINRAICELVDNGLDVQVRDKTSKQITIKIFLDATQQTIIVEDNAGGLKKTELSNVVGPGQTGTNADEETIGIFGVGTKRAVIALAQDIKIETRYSKEKTHLVEFDDAWIAENDNWTLPYYEVSDISPGTTIVELQKLRYQITSDVILRLKDHLRITYAKFIKENKIRLMLNDEDLFPKFFNNWAYPPGYHPRKYTGALKTHAGQTIRVEATAGLSRESSPATGEYGVYFYCNDRMIARALKTFDVGFAKGYAGAPHPKISLTRVLVCLNGEAKSMPWNSSKSDISTKHEVFLALRDWLMKVVSDYAALSRIWVGEWPEKVFKYKTGKIEEIKIEDFPSVKKSYLPDIPKSRPRYSEVVTNKNSKIAKEKPWTKGLYEGVIAADFISKQHLDQKNRIALIVLDSTLEIAFKEFLVNESGQTYNDAKLLSIFNDRTQVVNEMKKYTNFKPSTWKKISHYYWLRCELIHKRATVGIGDGQLDEFRKVTEDVLKKLFKLRFSVE